MKAGFLTLFSLLLCFFLASCSPSVESPPPSAMVQVLNKSELSGKSDGKPVQVKVGYSFPEDSPLYGETRYCAFLSVHGGRGGLWYEAVPAEKTEKGYKLLTGKNKGFVISEDGGFGYTNVVRLQNPNGEFVVSAANGAQALSLANSLEEPYTWTVALKALTQTGSAAKQ